MRAKTYTDIDYLNAILMAFNYDGFVEDDYQLDKDFIDIILQSRCPKVNTPYHSKMGVETCTNYSIDFLDKISPKFSTRLERLIDSFHVDFEDEEESRVEVIDGSKFIRICRAKTVEDSYTLTHEAIREYNMDAINPTDNWDLTVEALSILASMLQKDYFAKMYEPPRDYKNNEANTLYDLYLKAILLDFEIKLISYHAKYDYISECLLDKLVDSYGRYASRIRAHLFHILKDAHLCVHELHRDIVGGILSTHMYERISNNPKLIKEFVELNDWCNNMEFKDTIKYLDLDLASENNVILSNRSIKELRKEFRKRCKNVSN